jgi:prephenate dehydratase
MSLHGPVAAVAPMEAAEMYGLRVLDTGIANERNAETRYLILGRRAVLDDTFGFVYFDQNASFKSLLFVDETIPTFNVAIIFYR